MFDKRTDLVRFLAVADTGKIAATAERLAITQPTLTRDIARLEHRFGGKLFERLPHGVRLTALGAATAECARRVLRELQAADEAIGAVRSGRTGVVRVSATPPWSETVLAPAAARFHDAFPHIELRLDTTTRAEGLRRLADGATDLHCGGIDGDEPLPDFLRRERFLDMTAGVVASGGSSGNAAGGSSAGASASSGQPLNRSAVQSRTEGAFAGSTAVVAVVPGGGARGRGPRDSASSPRCARRSSSLPRPSRARKYSIPTP